jgi:uncharacterized protein YndB with AHSA1/START domain
VSDAAPAAAVTPAAAVHLSRTFAAPREQVFRAWTDADRFGRWFGPVYGSTSGVEMDARIGGRYRIEMKPTWLSTVYVGGTYLEVEPPERLVFTFAWEEDPGSAARLVARLLGFPGLGETRVTVQFHELGESTEISLTHELLDTRRRRSFHRVGWTASCNRLAKLLEAGGPP